MSITYVEGFNALCDIPSFFLCVPFRPLLFPGIAGDRYKNTKPILLESSDDWPAPTKVNVFFPYCSGAE